MCQGDNTAHVRFHYICTRKVSQGSRSVNRELARSCIGGMPTIFSLSEPHASWIEPRPATPCAVTEAGASASPDVSSCLPPEAVGVTPFVAAGMPISSTGYVTCVYTHTLACTGSLRAPLPDRWVLGPSYSAHCTQGLQGGGSHQSATQHSTHRV